MIGKNVRIGGKLDRITLTEDEEEEVMEELLKKNAKKMERCLEEGKRIVEKYRGKGDYSINETDVALALFDKQATASFTVLSEAIEKKVMQLKQPSKTT